MKQLLLITAISCVCCTQVFAGSNCKTCQKAPAQESKEKTIDCRKGIKETETALLATNSCSATTTPAPVKTDENSNPDMTDDTSTDGKMEQKTLLAGGSSPSNTDVPATTGDEGKDDAMSEKKTETQLVA